MPISAPAPAPLAPFPPNAPAQAASPPARLTLVPPAAAPAPASASASASAPDGNPPPPDLPGLGRRHARRLRDIYRSAGWPCHDGIEIDLLAAGLLARLQGADGRETLRLTEAGIRHLAQASQRNRAARSAHEALVAQVAQWMQRDGRLVWTGLSLRADVAPFVATATAAGPARPGAPVVPSLLAGDEAAGAVPAVQAPRAQWKLCRPDVFSIRPSSVAACLDPTIHEIKVSRADLLGDLKKADKRAAYLGIGGQCWYVLGQDARGRAIADPNEIPLECGVLLAEPGRLHVARMAPRRAASGLPLHVWLALARAAALPEPADGEGLL